MIGGVVGDKVDLDPVVVAKELVQELGERLRVEPLHEPGMPLGIDADSDCSHDLDAFSHRWTQHLDSNTHAHPCPADGTGLLKHRFVLIEHYASFLFGFFLMAGGSLSRHVRWAFSSAFDRFLP